MKVLWLCNIMLPKVAQALNIKQDEYGGWLTGLSNDLLKTDRISLCACFPKKNTKDIESGSVDELQYFAFPQNLYYNFLGRYRLESYFKTILYSYKPDIIHIHGSETPTALAMIRACQLLGLKDKIVISIQGLVSVYAKHYDSGLPFNVINGFTFKEIIRNNNIRKHKQYLIKNGEFEVQALKNVKHVIGRTDWDKACVEQINQNAKYHFCNETLRSQFYLNKWDIEKCKKNSIFISQASYPLKGFHRVLEAMPEVVKRFPNAHIYVAGNNIARYDTLKSKLRIGSYGKYIRLLIRKYYLENNVTFLGELNEVDMCKQYLASNVFVSASSIENSPNSVGEAMILGVPTISSDVGGVKNLLLHNEEGFIYQHDAPYMLSYYIKKIFGNNILAEMLSCNARLHANKINNREINVNKIIDIYRKIADK